MPKGMERVAVIGASGGIGAALVAQLIARESVVTVFACSRSGDVLVHDKVVPVQLDLVDEVSVQVAAKRIAAPLDLVIVATGMLGDGNGMPEKALRELDLAAMSECFAVNTLGPAIVAKYFLPALPRDRRSVFAALSARVGSISDNRLGGWYSYRASKAALNMLIKTAAIEVGRRCPESVIVGLHPGTVDTRLSKPFQRRVRHAVFSPEESAGYLLQVIDQLGPGDTGKSFDWRGDEIAP